MKIADYAALLDDATRSAQAVPQLSAANPGLSLADAYAIQQQGINRRIARGERVVGVKMGFTSRPKMEQMGVSDQIWGQLTDAMVVPSGGGVALSRFIHGRAEPEIAMRLGRALHGIVTLEEAMAAVDGIAPAIEIVDSRYVNFRFSLVDVVADNASASAFVAGPWVDPAGIDLSDIPMTLEFDGTVVQQGSSSEVLGNPWQSLVEAARLAADAGITLQPGWIVSTGAATAAEVLPAGAVVRVSAGPLGSASLRVLP